MKQLVCAGALMLAAFTSCSKDELNINPGDNDYQAPVYTRISASLPQTRTTTDGGFNTLWNAGDAIGLFLDGARCEYTSGINTLYKEVACYNINYVVASGSGSAQASFGYVLDPVNTTAYTGNMFWNTKNETYKFYAYYPFNSVKGGNMVNSKLPFALPASQTQLGADSKAHIGAMDFMYASLPVSRPEGAANDTPIDELNFSFTHAFALMEFAVTNQTDAPVVICKVVLDANQFIAGDILFNITDGSRQNGKTVKPNGMTVTDGISSNEITLLTKNADNSDLTLEAGASAKVYMVVNPAQLTAASIRVETNDEKAQTFTGTVTLEAGKYYKKPLVLNNLQSL